MLVLKMQKQLELAGLRRDWCEEAAPMVAALAPGLGEFTADDLRGKIPEPEHPNWWGVMLAQLGNTGVLVRIGWRKSTRAEANGRPIGLWRSA